MVYEFIGTHDPYAQKNHVTARPATREEILKARYEALKEARAKANGTDRRTDTLLHDAHYRHYPSPGSYKGGSTP